MSILFSSDLDNSTFVLCARRKSDEDPSSCVVYLRFWRMFGGPVSPLSIDDRFQFTFFELTHTVSYKAHNTLRPFTCRLTRHTFSLFSWSCNMILIFRRVSSSFFNSCRRLCIFAGTAAVRPFLKTEFNRSLFRRQWWVLRPLKASMFSTLRYILCLNMWN